MIWSVRWAGSACTSARNVRNVALGRCYATDITPPDAAASTTPAPPPEVPKATEQPAQSSKSAFKQLANLIPINRSATPSRNFSPVSSVPDITFPHNIRTALTIRTLMAANLHLGHAKATWNQNMLPYIYGERQGIHIINLEHTLVMLRRAINVTREVALRGGNILFVGTRPSIHRITVEAAKRADAYFVTSWVGGTITNKERVLRRSVGYDPDKVAQTLEPPEDAQQQRQKRRSRRGNAISEEDNTPKKPRNPQPYVHTPDLLIILDYANNAWAVREANQANIPVIAICDTDCNPRRVQYPIPANDDALTGVELIAGALSLASREGRDMRIKEQEMRDEEDSRRFAQMEERKERMRR